MGDVLYDKHIQVNWLPVILWFRQQKGQIISLSQTDSTPIIHQYGEILKRIHSYSDIGTREEKISRTCHLY